MRISIKNLTKKFGATVALNDVSLEIAAQELFFLLGPSGCGKTTLLRVLAGFYEPDGGELFFGEHSMRGVPPHRRSACVRPGPAPSRTSSIAACAAGPA